MGRIKAVDRVMRAYEQKNKLTEEQARIIWAEVCKFIDEMLGSVHLPLDWPKRGASAEPG